MSQNQMTVMCTTYGERRLISIRRQEECVNSKFVILQNDIYFDQNIPCGSRVISIFTNCKGMHERTDSHRDNSAHLRLTEFFFHCEAHQDVLNTHSLLLKHK